jgi:hypothetical protein
MECFGTIDFGNNSRFITLSAIVISGLHRVYFEHTTGWPVLRYRKIHFAHTIGWLVLRYRKIHFAHTIGWPVLRYRKIHFAHTQLDGLS